MKLSFNISLLALGFSCWLSSCSKDKGAAPFSAVPSVYFIYRSNASMDSLTYTFVEKAATVTIDTVWLTVRVAGSTAANDRGITVNTVSATTTAVEGTHYKLLPYRMPKDSLQTRLGVVLLRDASLRDKQVELTLTLAPSADFPVLMKESIMADGIYYSRNKVRILFSDKLIKPANWESNLASFFGAYSETKFRFMTGILGRSSFPTSGTGALKFFDLQYFQTTVRNALVTYTAANGPLIDEKGQTVVFP
jgi:hypothetical protein